MATITGLTAERMLAIEGESVVDGQVDVDGNLILSKYDGSTINAGPVLGPTGAQGPPGPQGGHIPGEIKLWPGSALPDTVVYGKWVWADGAVYVVATYPKAAVHIAPEWRTFAGASDPGASNFRVPDLRGLTPAGMDQMPGGARANRLTRAVSIVLAGRSGEETHVITIPEMPAHYHVQAPVHTGVGYPSAGYAGGGVSSAGGFNTSTVGGSQAHENMQPTVFVPYIVKLDD
jgi:microcystin-dependent protein